MSDPRHAAGPEGWWTRAARHPIGVAAVAAAAVLALVGVLVLAAAWIGGDGSDGEGDSYRPPAGARR